MLRLPNEELRELFQTCIEHVPSPWITALLLGVAKGGPRDLTDARDYRTIGLGSCLVKTLALMIDRRLPEWSDAHDIILESQNGFRAGHRTNNNAFVLRIAIEGASINARMNGRPIKNI